MNVRPATSDALLRSAVRPRPLRVLVRLLTALWFAEVAGPRSVRFPRDEDVSRLNRFFTSDLLPSEIEL